MKRLGLHPLILWAKITYYEWAQREIHPLHPDAPMIVLRLAKLRGEL